MTTTTAPPGGGGHSSPLGLMSCVRESSPQDLVPQTELMDVERNETKKRRFHPFRGLRKMFRRGVTTSSGKVRNAGSEETVPADSCTSGHEDTTSTKDAHRSRSTSELLASDEAATRRKSGGGNGNGSSGGMYTGGGNLSVSHDSVFTAEQRSTRGDSTSSDLDTAQSSSSLSIQQLMHQTGVRAELLDVVRRRGRGRGDTSEDEEDLGLPRSPCNSPTTTDKALKEHPTKSHSTCSDGSLLSMGSSEMDEDSFGQHSRHSSKLSLHDRRPTQNADTDLELGTASLNAPLSHSAARHKMSVRPPNRKHRTPRRKRVQQVTTKLTAGSALPTTPEVNEEASTRSLTPEGSTTRETIAELYSSSSTSMNKVWNNSAVVPETQLKSASLPPGLALPSGSKLSRSRSNAGKVFAEEDEDTSKEDKKKEESFFGRFLARRSGKKKKSKSEDADIQTAAKFTEKVETSTTSLSSTTSYKYTEEKRTFSVDSGISKVARSGPAARQRVQPIDIPSSPESFRQKRHQNMDLDLPLLPPVTANSPEQPSFLEASPPTKKMHVFLPKTKVSPVTVSPDKSDPLPDNTPAIPIPSPRTIMPRKPSIPETTTRTILPQSPPKPCHEITPAPRNILPNLSPPKLSSWADPQKSEDLKTKVKITGLSSYQQRFMSYNDELDNGFKSLEETSEKLESISSVSLTKSHSFRSKTVLTSSQDHASLPYTVNSVVYDTNSDSETFTDSLMSTTTPISDHSDTVTVNKDSGSDNEIKIINTNAEIVEHVPQSTDKKEDFIESTSSVFISNEKESIEIENKKDGVTICVNPPQVQASANPPTKTVNPVIVSIDSSEADQVSVSKVQLKRDSKNVVETTTAHQVVPEFLKIQLNKVDVKPSTNVVLSTSNSFGKADEKPKQKSSVLEIETDRESGEIITDNIKRKFSTDVEIIDKETVEEIIEVPTKNVETKVSRCSFPIMINQTSQPRKSSMGAGNECSLTNKSFLKKKSNSLELDSIKMEDRLPSNKANSSDQLATKSETTKEKLNSLSDSEKQDSSPPEVIMRKKSLGSQKSDKDTDEPELMKVFARRSLKLKDSEAETLSQQVMVLVEADKTEASENSKRDSDKENEGSESPIEERKKAIFPSSKEPTNPKPKEPLCESKFVETADVTLRKPSSALNNKLSVFGGAKYQRAVSLQTAVPNDVNDNTTNEEKRRNKSFIEPKVEKKPVISSYRAPTIMNMREKDIEIKTTDSNKLKNEDEFKKTNFENEDYVPRFKRIQQRKEEWEKRAQQNMKKSVP